MGDGTAEVSNMVDVVSSVGLPIALVLFVCYLCWRTVKFIGPHAVEWLKSMTRQADAVTSSVPRIERSLEEIAKHNPAELLRRVEEKVDSVSARVDEIKTKIGSGTRDGPT